MTAAPNCGIINRSDVGDTLATSPEKVTEAKKNNSPRLTNPPIFGIIENVKRRHPQGTSKLAA